MKFQKVYAEACEKKRAKEDIKREAELKLERAKKKEEKQAEKLRRYESYPLSKMYTLLSFLKTLLDGQKGISSRRLKRITSFDWISNGTPLSISFDTRSNSY